MNYLKLFKNEFKNAHVLLHFNKLKCNKNTHLHNEFTVTFHPVNFKLSEVELPKENVSLRYKNAYM